METVAFEDLGTESVKRLFVRDFPALVAISANGESLYDRAE